MNVDVFKNKICITLCHSCNSFILILMACKKLLLLFMLWTMLKMMDRLLCRFLKIVFGHRSYLWKPTFTLSAIFLVWFWDLASLRIDVHLWYMLHCKLEYILVNFERSLKVILIKTDYINRFLYFPIYMIMVVYHLY